MARAPYKQQNFQHVKAKQAKLRCPPYSTPYHYIFVEGSKRQKKIKKVRVTLGPFRKKLATVRPG